MTFHDFDQSGDFLRPVSYADNLVSESLLAKQMRRTSFVLLFLGVLYEKTRFYFPMSNFIYHLQTSGWNHVLADNNAMICNGSEVACTSVTNQSGTGVPWSTPVQEDFYQFLSTNLLQFGVPEPDLSYYERHPSNYLFYLTFQNIGCDIHRSAPNVCQKDWLVMILM